MHWEQDPTTGEWVMRDDMATLLADEPARYGPPTAGEPGGPPLTPGPVWEPPPEEAPLERGRPKDDDPDAGGYWADYPPDGGGYTHPDMGFLPVEPEIIDAESDAGVERYPIDGVERGRYGPDEWSSLRPVVPDDTGRYDNYDENVIAEWERGVLERGNEIRDTAVGTFEVKNGTNNILSKPPSPYPLN